MKTIQIEVLIVVIICAIAVCVCMWKTRGKKPIKQGVLLAASFLFAGIAILECMKYNDAWSCYKYIKCVECHAELSKSFNYCTQCGRALDDYEENRGVYSHYYDEADERSWRCNECKAINSSDNKYCYYCGSAHLYYENPK